VTPAIKLLERAGIEHRVLSYEHDRSAASYGAEAADALGLDPGEVFKTLVAVVDTTTHVVAVVPVATSLDLRALAAAARGKKAAMADPADAQRLTGYVVGGISPLGQKRRLATYIDRSAEQLETIHVSAGRRGLEVALAPGDLVAVLQGQLADISSS
jgi:Cys-tRNA(Pro)/Cys-tRNA(Cys) deacylase